MLLLLYKNKKAEADLNDLKNLLDNPHNSLEMKFLLLEQKYFEYLDEGRTIDALYSLRHEITTLNHNLNRVHELSRFIMCTNADELRKLSGWQGKGSFSRQRLMDKLQSKNDLFYLNLKKTKKLMLMLLLFSKKKQPDYLPPNIMLPPRRLRTLLNQSINFQISKCVLHNCLNDTFSLDTATLLTDHYCPM